MKINQKLEKFLEQQKNLRILEEQKREKLALEHQKELEREAEEYKEKQNNQMQNCFFTPEINREDALKKTKIKTKTINL